MPRGGERRRSDNRSSGRLAHLKKLASEPLQDGVEPASKAPNTLAPKIAVKRRYRVEQKAKEQARFESLKRKVSEVAISPAVVATTARRHEAPSRRSGTYRDTDR